MRHTRLWAALFVPLVVAAGLLTRSALPMPGLVRTYGGDTLYAVLIYVLLSVAVPAWRPRGRASVAAIICLLIELSQLVDVGWLNQVRANRLGALVLGRGFVWSDLACYTVGAAGAGIVEWGGRTVTQRT